MFSTKFYLDTRRKSGTGYLLRLNIGRFRKVTAFPIGIQIKKEQWDAVNCKIINHEDAKFLNTMLSSKKGEVDAILYRLAELEPERALAMTLQEVRDYVLLKTNPAIAAQIEQAKEKKLSQQKKQDKVATVEKQEDDTLVKVWFEKAISHKRAKRTKELYVTTRNRLKDWLGEEAWDTLHFEDIKRDWLLEFDDFMAQTAPSANTRAINMRNLRAVCNEAIDNEVTNYYPFRRFKIQTETTRKRSLDVETLRRIFAYRCSDKRVQRHLDAFKLSFMLIGINVVDLCHLKEIRGGRVEYIRAKTHRPYDIKVEYEARQLMDLYQGKKYLLNYIDNCTDYRFFYKHLCEALRTVRDDLKIEELTTYYARHTWATIASALDISHDTIAHALGHGGNTVTDVYIDFDMKKVDEANRRVLDYVLYGVKEKAEEKRKPGRPQKNA